MHQMLFLCTGNFYRSRFAELWFNHHAQREGLLWQASSRGLRLTPALNQGSISPFARSRLTERGVPLLDPLPMPQALTEDDWRQATRIIAMKHTEHEPLVRAGFPEAEGRVEYWHIDDVDCELPDQALAKLERQLDDLLRELATQS
jgi:protein-tyrosine phosphatase